MHAGSCTLAGSSNTGTHEQGTPSASVDTFMPLYRCLPPMMCHSLGSSCCRLEAEDAALQEQLSAPTSAIFQHGVMTSLHSFPKLCQRIAGMLRMILCRYSCHHSLKGTAYQVFCDQPIKLLHMQQSIFSYRKSNGFLGVP